MNAKKMKTHWVADIFPLNESDIDAIAEDIKANGQLVPIKVLSDGTIVDGRNRWMACQKAGVQPITEIIDLMDDDKMLSLSISLNDKRRKTSKQQNACAAALAWKRIYPEGKPKAGRPKKGEESNPKIGVTFPEFAFASFEVTKTYAEQALAVLNWSPDEFEKAMAKDSLAETYEAYCVIKKKQDESDKKRKFITAWREAPVSKYGTALDVQADLIDQLDNKKITEEQAFEAAKRREKAQDHFNQQYADGLDSIMRRIEGLAEVTKCHECEFKDFAESDKYKKNLKDLIGKAEQAIATIKTKLQ